MRHRSVALVLLAWLGMAHAAFAQAPGEPSAVIAPDCDHECLVGFARGYMEALARKDPTRVRFAANVRFTENNVELPLGKEGLWSTISAVPASGLEAADPTSGEAAWIGAVEERGQPVYFGLRLRVQDRAIVEAETVVVRNSGLPLPFGDVSKVVHDPAFAQVLPAEQRRPRERLVAVANSYFSTVELNDGTVFAPFDPDCGRLENGISTTSGNNGSASIAQGCEAQFRLGIYRINKRVRERRYPLVDVERGVVVATGFFDHANEFDTYRTTDGKERKTLLKWPNSISLVEAFKIRDGKIYRIEAVFTYVPYFMHSPFYSYSPVAEPAPTVRSANPAACDRACLTKLADAYMEALVRHEPGSLPWARRVRFTENSVPMMIGDGLWGSAQGKSADALRVADPVTGDVVWYGVVYEHDAPSYYGMRMRVEDGHIAEVQSVLARARNPGPFGDPAKFKVDAAFQKPLAKRPPVFRALLVALAAAYANSTVPGVGAELIQNGAAIANGSAADRVRPQDVIVADEERGIAVVSRFADYASRDKYPSTRELFEVLLIRDGPVRKEAALPELQAYGSPNGWSVRKVEALSVFQPWGMPPAWH